jgi:hypothetical protein
LAYRGNRREKEKKSSRAMKGVRTIIYAHDFTYRKYRNCFTITGNEHLPLDTVGREKIVAMLTPQKHCTQVAGAAHLFTVYTGIQFEKLHEVQYLPSTRTPEDIQYSRAMGWEQDPVGSGTSLAGSEIFQNGPERNKSLLYFKITSIFSWFKEKLFIFKNFEKTCR